MKYTLYEDPGHAWLKVSKTELAKLGILNKISGYSYQDKDNAYLEEDCDKWVFIEAKCKTKEDQINFVHNEIETIYKENLFVRNLNHY